MVQWSAHLSFLFSESSFLDRPAAASDAGFRWVETAWPGDELDAFARRVTALGLGVACLNSYAGDVRAGDRGIVNDPARADEADLAFRAAVDLAERVDARCIHVPLGRAVTSASLPQQRGAAIAALRRHGRLARSRDLKIVLEPINARDSPGYLAPSLPAVAALIDDVGDDAVRILFDAYHVARAGDDPIATIAEYAGLIGHAQFSDAPGRGMPGSGTLDLSAFANELVANGYRGAIGLEWVPRGDTVWELSAIPDIAVAAPLRTR